MKSNKSGGLNYSSSTDSPDFQPTVLLRWKTSTPSTNTTQNSPCSNHSKWDTFHKSLSQQRTARFFSTHHPGNSAGDLFGLVKWPFERLSDPQLRIKRPTCITTTCVLSFFCCPLPDQSTESQQRCRREIWILMTESLHCDICDSTQG